MLDAGLLIAEDSDRHVGLAIGGMAIIEGGAPDDGRLETLLKERIRAIPRCTQLLRSQPLHLGPPKWVNDPGFDVNRHVRRFALPRPGDDAELFRAVADVLQRRLDRDRPLWECWVIEGLKGNRWAILLKIHHSIADGVSATRILTRLCDETDGDAFAPAVRPHRAATAPVHLRPVPHLPRRNPADNLWRVATTLTSAAARTVLGAAETAAGLIQLGAGSSLGGPVSATRCYRAVRVPLAEVEQVCRGFDVTVNDVALAAITEGFRSVSLHRGEQPRPDSQPALLPVEEHDPVQQLRTVHIRLRRAQQGGQRSAGSMVTSAADHLPFRLTRLITRLPQRSLVTLKTNVSGPLRRLKLAKRNVIEVLPIPPIAPQLRTGVAVLSYADDLVFGITADDDAGPDVEQLVNGITRAVGRLVALSEDCVLLFAK